MEASGSAPKKRNTPKESPQAPSKKENKFLEGLKKIGFNVWLVVMVIGGTLAFITALFLL